MAKMNINERREKREKVFELLFETEFRSGENSEDILCVSSVDRGFENDEYIRSTYLGVCEHRGDIDLLIGKFAKGWKTDRLTKVSRSIIRLGVYEMKYVADIPNAVAINEAVELSKKFDDDKARPFINGVLNSIKNYLEEQNKSGDGVQ